MSKKDYEIFYSEILSSNKDLNDFVDIIFFKINKNNWNIFNYDDLLKIQYNYSIHFKMLNNINGIINIELFINNHQITDKLFLKIKIEFYNKIKITDFNYEIKYDIKKIIYNFRKQECFIYNDNVYDVWNRNIQLFINQTIREDTYKLIKKSFQFQ